MFTAGHPIHQASLLKVGAGHWPSDPAGNQSQSVGKLILDTLSFGEPFLRQRASGTH